MNPINIRKAEIGDLMLYFEWANDKAVRESAVSQEPILLDTHRDWFSGKISRENSELYVFEQEGKPVGQVRFDIENTIAFIDYSIDKNFRGKSLGFQILRLGLEHFSTQDHHWRVKEIRGKVKLKNIPSLNIFRKLGFIENKKSGTSSDYIMFSIHC